MAVAAAVVLAVVAVVVLAGGSADTPPAGGAAALVPSDALVYVNLSTDPGRGAVGRTLQLAKGFPGYPLAAAAVETQLGSLLGSSVPVDFARDVRPWLGRDAALAVLDTTTSTAGSLLLLEVSDRGRASSFLTRAGFAAGEAASYRGTQLRRAPGGTEAVFVGHYLALGQDAAVRAAIDVAAGAATSLQDDSTYRRATAGEPDGRVLDAYASAAGVQRVLASRGGAIGALGALLYQPSLQGAAISLVPVSGGATLQIHTTFDPSLSALNGSGGAPFTPTLQNVIPSGSTLMLDLAGLDRAAPRILAAGGAAGIAGGLGPLLSRLGTALKAEGVNVPAILSLFGGETAVAIGTAGAGAPSLTVVAHTAHEDEARSELAALEVPLAQLFPTPTSGPGGAPELGDSAVDGVTVHRLDLTPGLQLDYAVFNGLVVFSTSAEGIAGVISHRSSLGTEREFRSAASVPQKRITSLLFLDLRQLLSLGEQMGLTYSTPLRALLPDLERVRAVGMSSTGGEDDSTAELSLHFQ